MKTIDLIQPRHSYAPEQGIGHIYTNSSLRTAGAQIEKAGAEVFLHDENINPADIHGDVVGFNLLGALYIPVVIERIKKLRNHYGNELQIVLGGQVMNPHKGLSNTQFKHLFGKNVYNGMIPGVVEDLLEISKLPSEFQTSLIPMYEKLSDEEFWQYFHKREISFFVSQGCIQNCSFCAAVKGKAERYRDMQIIYDDLFYLTRRLINLGAGSSPVLDIYMTNLDVFQTPLFLNMFADVILDLKKFWNCTYKIRGLAGAAYFMKLHKSNPALLHKLVEAGFDTAGYGVDGIGKEVRQKIKKPQNTEENILGAIELSRKEYNITPELLMVFGHVGVDNEDTLKTELEFVAGMVDLYQATPRPHISKPFIPGNDGWNDPQHQQQIEELMKDPALFQTLDFTALPSEITHPDKKLRELAGDYFMKMCELPGNTTIPIIPLNPGDSEEKRALIMEQNLGKYDR